MEFETRRQDGILRIDVLSKRIDAACAIQFKDRMRDICADPPPRIVLNLRQVDFLDSSGLGAVVAVKKHLGQERSLELAGLTPKVQKVFQLTRMDSVFVIHGSADEILGGGSHAA
ncbi:STAS domain-containing protein [Tropicimonas isoalkanivorans]|uniref:Anti-sigma factor antagonist n=1 Tax=Tropicimonas isoalkanivorans TaxID=441112 RepID=A0A1I1L0D5_9RHOB|nr:STAS domain-containing protein [Tropicimonas isoalkanivorans]SFC63863.1 anti-sigma B factor antagonist [Tropicimonas isoalkanivorans]